MPDVQTFLTVIVAIAPFIFIYLVELIVCCCWYRSVFSSTEEETHIKKSLLVKDGVLPWTAREGTSHALEDSMMDVVEGERCASPAEGCVTCCSGNPTQFRQRWQLFNDVITQTLIFGGKPILSFNLPDRINRIIGFHFACGIVTTVIKVAYNLAVGPVNGFDVAYVVVELVQALQLGAVIGVRCGYWNLFCVWTCSCCMKINPRHRELYKVLSNQLMVVVFASSLSSTAVSISSMQLIYSLLDPTPTLQWYQTTQFQKVVLNWALYFPTLWSTFYLVSGSTRLWPLLKGDTMNRRQAQFLIRWIREFVEPFQFFFRNSTKISMDELRTIGVLADEEEQTVSTTQQHDQKAAEGKKDEEQQERVGVEEEQQQQQPRDSEQISVPIPHSSYGSIEPAAHDYNALDIYSNSQPMKKQVKHKKPKPDALLLPTFKHSWAQYLLLLYIAVAATVYPIISIVNYQYLYNYENS